MGITKRLVPRLLVQIVDGTTTTAGIATLGNSWNSGSSSSTGNSWNSNSWNTQNTQPKPTQAPTNNNPWANLFGGNNNIFGGTNTGNNFSQPNQGNNLYQGGQQNQNPWQYVFG